MYKQRSILAIVPARGGSKGIKKKNIRPLLNKPLVAWTIEEAKKSVLIDRIIVSSDDLEIIEVAKQYGADAPFIRPSELAQDDTPGVLPVLHSINELPGYDYIILLQPTSPLRRVTDIDKALRQCIDQNGQILVSVAKTRKSPYWMYKLDIDLIMSPLFPDTVFTRRQDIPPVFETNGAIYIAGTRWLKEHRTFIHPETKGYVMNEEDSYDIDTLLDFYICEQLLRQRDQE
jgi:CMP-N,N'-diacetyllegionaminic acid synthase